MNSLLVKLLLFFSIIFSVVIGCNNNNSPSSDMKFNYSNQLSKGLIIINETDKLDVFLDEFNKEYLFDLKGFTKNGDEINIEKNWTLYFTIINIDDKGLFVPNGITPNGTTYNTLGIKIMEDYSTNLILEIDSNFHFEIEICSWFVDKRTVVNKKGITQSNESSFHADKIFDILEKADFKKIKKNIKIPIRKRTSKNKNEICRKIKVKQKDTSVLFTEIETKNMNKSLLKIYDKISITENGNLLDTLQIDKSIWTNYKRTYRE